MSEVPQGVGQRPWPGRPHSCSSSVSVYLGDGPLIPPPTPSSPKPEISARADPLSSERDTQASQGQIKARFWPWLSGKSAPSLSGCPLFARQLGLAMEFGNRVQQRAKVGQISQSGPKSGPGFGDFQVKGICGVPSSFSFLLLSSIELSDTQVNQL